MRRREQIQVEIRCYPKDDRAFVEDAERAVAESREIVRRTDRLLAAVRAKLREQYPDVQITPRDPIAAPSPDDPEVWYCYRDGHLVA